MVQLSNKGVADEERISGVVEKSGWTLEAAVMRLEMLLDERQASGEQDREKAEQVVDKNQWDAQKHDGDIQELQQVYTTVTWETVNSIPHRWTDLNVTTVSDGG